MKQHWFWFFALLLGVAGCKTAGKFSYPPEKIVPTEKSVVWEISGNGLKKKSYLYGTIHMIPKSQFELPASIAQAMRSAKRVAFEIDMKEMTNLRTQMTLLTKSFMSGKTTLKDLLSPEDYALVRQKMTEKGLVPGMFERVKPMFLSTLFSSEEEGGESANLGAMTSVEMELYRRARREKIESAGLETAGYQMALFDSIPYATQAKMLVDGLRSTEQKSDGESELDKMLRLYRTQDISAMQALIAGEDSEIAAYEDLLLGKRNRNWIPIMRRYMGEKPTIFAVGAGHLGGSQGVVALLRGAGYKVEAVYD